LAGIIIGAKFYFNFTESFEFDQMYSSLVKELGDKGKKVSRSENSYELSV